ncbi:MAG: hypothetical protein ACRCZP_02530 [Phycicoccus sp.]
MHREPVAIAETVRLVLVALVAVGWVTLDDTAVMSVATAVGALVSVAASLWARARVTPT